MEILRQALVKSRQGDITINTPFAASELHSLIVETFDLDFDTVRLKRVEFADILFSVKQIVFNFSFSPNHPFHLKYRHMESDKWHDAGFKNTNDDIQHIIDIVKDKVFDNPPSPIS